MNRSQTDAPVILLVDDERPVLNSLRRTLTQDGYLLLDAQDGESALKILRNRDVDLIVADQRMPGMSGVELLQRVRREHPEVLTIMLTAYSDMDVALQAINDIGIYKFLLKPWDANELRESVRRGLAVHRGSESGRPTDESEARCQQARDKDAMLRQWEAHQPGITKVKRNADGVYIIDPEDLRDASAT